MTTSTEIGTALCVGAGVTADVASMGKSSHEGVMSGVLVMGRIVIQITLRLVDH